MRLSVIWLLVAAAALGYADYIERPMVQTTGGVVRGSVEETDQGKKFYSFLGIPYAQPPIGPLRFQDPIPAEPWPGRRDATQFGPACPQISDTGETSEDCLTVNVFTPELPARTSVKETAVVFLIHPGSWVQGSGAALGPGHLIDRGLIVVTFNYRLGALGFLSTGDCVLPGNYAMKDAMLALRWTHDNIEAFGGSPYRITVAGSSCGAASVWLTLQSWMAVGLFQQALLISPPITSRWAVDRQPEITAKRLATLFKCPTQNSKSIKDCLMKVPARDLSHSLDGLREWYDAPGLLFFPVIEQDCGRPRFLQDDPMNIMAKGNFSKVPVMIGHTMHEFNDVPRVNESINQELMSRFSELAPITLIFERGTEKSKEISKQVWDFYLGGDLNHSKIVDRLGDMFSDFYVTSATQHHAQILACCSPAPVYVYQLAYDVSHHVLGGIGPGVLHADDYQFLFTPPLRSTASGNAIDPDFRKVLQYTTLLANFAKTGNPTPSKLDILDEVLWEPTNCKRRKHLQLAAKLHMADELNRERYKFWLQLFPYNGTDFCMG